MRLRQPVRYGTGRMGGRRSGKGRLIMALAIAAFALFSYFKSASFNEVTGEKQYISITPKQEIALGLQSAPQMAQQHGGLHPNSEYQQYVDRVGRRLVASNPEIAELPWQYDFHLLADPKVVNAFALPGGQTFITYALFSKLETEGQLAGVMGHEISHVVARHGAQRIAKGQLTQGLTGAVVVATDMKTAAAAQMIGQLVNMKYGRDDELESDRLGVDLMADAGYDPRSMIGVMRILAESRSGSGPPEFFSTHPNPENRVARIEESIKQKFPNGVPSDLVP